MSKRSETNRVEKYHEKRHGDYEENIRGARFLRLVRCGEDNEHHHEAKLD
jgi:hypothetical protein